MNIHWPHWSCVLFAFFVGGCLVPNPIGPPNDDGGSGQDDVGSGVMGDDGVDSGSDGSEATTEEATSGGSDAGPPADLPEEGQTCGNVDGLTMGCQTCLEIGCCEQLASCADDLLCACLLTCLLAGSEDEACSLECSGLPTLPSLVGVLSCVQESCADDC